MSIYFDNAASTPASPGAAGAAAEMSAANYGNPSALHGMGLNAERAVRAAAERVAAALGCRAPEVVFTSGGTEANNLAVLGCARARRRLGGHILTSAAEHPSVAQAVTALESEGFSVTRLMPDGGGALDPAAAAAAVRPDTVLASFIHVNNETGAINDARALAAAVKRANPSAAVHIDGVQAFCKVGVGLTDVDLYSISAHKLHGLKGTGALFVRGGVRLAPLLYGGGQQNGFRPGTENTPGIAAFAAAIGEALPEMEKSAQNARNIRKILMSLADGTDGVFINGDPIRSSPYILNMSFLGVKAEVLVHALEERGVYVSTGAACSSRRKTGNHLKWLGLDAKRGESAVRFSFSRYNTEEEARVCAEAVRNAVEELRRV
ncbi:MAG: cysteine desulfurase [Firmicutes bacterium]|nr:cysteine desulfurase [Bacillota bacterium]